MAASVSNSVAGIPLNGSDIAVMDNKNDELFILRWDGSTLEKVSTAGEASAAAGYNFGACALSGCDIAICSYRSGGYLDVYRFGFAVSKPWGYPFDGS